MIITYNSTTDKNINITAKQKAQEKLLLAMEFAFNQLRNGGSDDIDKMTDREKQIVLDQMDKQMARVEKIFGFVPRSYQRGC